MNFKPTSILYIDVTNLVHELGQACFDDLRPYFPNHTDSQIRRALENAAFKRLIKRSSDGQYSQFKPGEDEKPELERESLAEIVSNALRARLDVEKVWQNFAVSRSTMQFPAHASF
jgi:hypothetical protein